MEEDKYGGVTFIPADISPEHVTAAGKKLREYYTPYVAWLVSKMYEDDFRMFNYKHWDGSSEPVLN